MVRFRELMVALALASLCSCQSKDIVATGITISDGNGDIVGFNEYHLGSSEDDLDKTGWSSKSYKGSLSFQRVVSVETSEGVLAADLHLMFRNKKLTNIFLEGQDESLGHAIYNRLREEFGDRFPSRKLRDLDGYRLQDSNGNLLVLQRKDDGTPRLTIQ